MTPAKSSTPTCTSTNSAALKSSAKAAWYFEMPYITPRICGICPVSHHLAAAKAGDAVMGCPPPRPASLLRELMHMGQIIQSHGMHFFELAGPDLLLGFDADPAIRNVVGLIQANPELAVKAVKLRKFGQEIIHTLGGRRIHPVFAVPGGVNKALQAAERDTILAGVDEAIATIQVGLADHEGLGRSQHGRYQQVRRLPHRLLWPGHPGKRPGAVRWRNPPDRRGRRSSWKNSTARTTWTIIAEHVENWSYLKFPYYKKLGWPTGRLPGWPAGPPERLRTDRHPAGERRAEDLQGAQQRQTGRKHPVLPLRPPDRSPVRGREECACCCDDPDILSTDILNTQHDFKGEGVGVIEAPRGTLIHHYWANENGQLTKVNLIVATGHNNWAMSDAVDSVAKTYINGPEIREGMLNRVEAAIRAYDPCLSCSTHAVGQMPMVVDVVDVDGNMVKTLSRNV